MIRAGIDFGTTNSSIAVWRRHAGNQFGINLIPLNPMDSEVMPTLMAINDGMFAFGSEVVSFIQANPQALVIRNIKRYLGTDIIFKHNNREYTVSDLVGRLLTHMFERAKDNIVFTDLIAESSGIVMGVPVGLMDAAKEDLINGCLKANIVNNAEDIHFVAEPVAAAISYGVELDSREKIMVFDFGGGTIDISIVDMSFNNNAELDKPKILAKVGDNLGGSGIDQLILKEMLVPYIGEKRLKRAMRADPEIPIEELDRTAPGFQFMKQVEQSKIGLSSDTAYSFVYNFEGLSVEEELKRSELEIALKKWLERIDLIVDQALANADQGRSLTANNIDKVIMAGGSSLIPCVQELLRKKFPRKVFVSDNALTCITDGLARIAHSYSDGRTSHEDITDYDYGFLDFHNNQFVSIIDSGTPYTEAGNWRNRRVELINPLSTHLILRIMGRKTRQDPVELRRVRIDGLEQAVANDRFVISYNIDSALGVLKFEIYDNWETRYIHPENNTVPLKVPSIDVG